MNKTTKILLIVGGLTGLAFLTKKYWYKSKKSSFLNMEDESEENADNDMSMGMSNEDEQDSDNDMSMGMDMGMDMGNEDEQSSQDEQSSDATDDMAMGMSMGGADDNEMNGDSMGGLVKDMGTPASIMAKPVQQSILQAKAKNQANVNTPNFTPIMPKKSDVVRAKQQRIAKKVGLGLATGGLGLLAKRVMSKNTGVAGGGIYNKKAKPQMKKATSSPRMKKRKRKSGFSDFSDFN